MTWSEFRLARLLLAEEKVGTRLRQADQSDLEEEERSKDILRARGMVG